MSPSEAQVAHGDVAAKHRIIHLMAFGSTAFLLLLIAQTPMQQVAAAFAVALLGLSVEIVQYKLLESLFMEWWDVRDDAFGCLGAFALAQWGGLRRKIVRKGDDADPSA